MRPGTLRKQTVNSGRDACCGPQKCDKISSIAELTCINVNQVTQKLNRHAWHGWLTSQGRRRKMKLLGDSQDTRCCYSRDRHCSGLHWRVSISYSKLHSIPRENTPLSKPGTHHCPFSIPSTCSSCIRWQEFYKQYVNILERSITLNDDRLLPCFSAEWVPKSMIIH